MMVRFRPRVVLGAVAMALLLSGCGGGPGTPGTTSPSPTVSPTLTPYVFETPPPISTPALTPEGLGPMRLGTPAEEAVTQGWAISGDQCWRTSPSLLADGVELYFTDGRISEIWIGNASHSTGTGARVGMQIEQIETLYADDLTYETRDSLGGQVVLPIVRRGDHELLFFGLGDEDATPGPGAPLTGIAARAYGTDLTRPSC